MAVSKAAVAVTAVNRQDVAAVRDSVAARVESAWASGDWTRVRLLSDYPDWDARGRCPKV